MNEWDTTSLTPTFLEQLIVTEYTVDGDSRTNSIILRTEVVSSLQSLVHDSTNDNSSSELLHHTRSEQEQCLELETQTAEEKDISSGNVILCLDQDATVHSYSYRKSLESFSGYIFPEKTAYVTKAYNGHISDASNPSTTSFVCGPASIEQVRSAQTVLNEQSPTLAFRDMERSSARPHSSCSSDICHTSTFSPGHNHSLVNTYDSFNSGNNLSSSNSEPLLSETAEMNGRLTKVIEPIKKTRGASNFQDISSDCDNYVQSSDCGEVFDDDRDDDEYVNHTTT